MAKRKKKETINYKMSSQNESKTAQANYHASADKDSGLSFTGTQTFADYAKNGSKMASVGTNTKASNWQRAKEDYEASGKKYTSTNEANAASKYTSAADGLTGIGELVVGGLSKAGSAIADTATTAKKNITSSLTGYSHKYDSLSEDEIQSRIDKLNRQREGVANTNGDTTTISKEIQELEGSLETVQKNKETQDHLSKIESTANSLSDEQKEKVLKYYDQYQEMQQGKTDTGYEAGSVVLQQELGLSAKEVNDLGQYVQNKYDSEQDTRNEEYYQGLTNNLSDEQKNKLSTYYDDLQQAKWGKTDTGYEAVKAQLQNDTGYTEKQLKDAARYVKTGSSKKSEQNAMLNPVGSSVASIASNLVGGTMAAGEMGRYALYGDKTQNLNTNGYGFALSNESSDTREAVSNNIKNPVARFLYQTGMSMADSTTSIAAGLGTEGASLALMGMSAAAQGAKTNSENGGSGMQSVATAMAQGGAEVLFEKIPLDNLYKLAKGNVTESAVKSILKQANIEGLEEVGTDIANIITDGLINGGKSEVSTNARQYQENGYGKEESQALATKDFLVQLLTDYAGGAISGGVMSGSVVGANYALKSSAGADVDTDTVVAKANAIDNYTVQQALDKYNNKQSNANLADLASAVQNYENTNGEVNIADLSQNESENSTSDNELEANLLGNSNTENNNENSNEKSNYNSNEITETPANINDYEETSTNSNKDVETSTNNYKTVANSSEIAENNNQITADNNEVSSNNSKSQETKESYSLSDEDKKWFGNYLTNDNASGVVEAYKVLSEADNLTEDEKTNFRNTYERQIAKFDAEGRSAEVDQAIADRYSASDIADFVEQGGTIPEEVRKGWSTSKQLEYNQAVADKQQNDNYIKDVNNMTATSGEDTVSLGSIKNVGENATVEITRGTSTETADLSDLDIPTATKVLYDEASTLKTDIAANMVVENYNPNVSVKLYTKEMKAAYHQGLGGQEFNPSKIAENFISKNTLKAMYEQGVKEKNAAHTEEMHKKQKENAAHKANKSENAGKTKMSDSTSDTVKSFVKSVAEKLGVEVEEADLEDIFRGNFEEKVGKITINENMNDASKMEAFAHEMGEWMKTWNSKDMKQTVNAIVDFMRNKEGSEKVDGDIEYYRSEYEKVEGSKTFEDATEEYAFDHLLEVIAADDGGEEFINYLDQNYTETEKKSILQKIVDFLKDIIDRLVNLGDDTISFDEQTQTLREIRSNFMKAIDVAIENQEKSISTDINKNDTLEGVLVAEALKAHVRNELQHDVSSNNDTISQEKIENKNLENNSAKRYSLAIDSEGRKLSEKQQEYFANTKVVDEDGNLQVVYHGSPNEFYEFDYDKIGATGSAEGYGFYFTDQKEKAEGYTRSGGTVMKGYLNISNPLSLNEKTLKKTELKKLIQKLDPTGDELLSNYDMTGEGYPSKAWYNSALKDTMEALMDYNENDADIIAEIANTMDQKDIIHTVREVLGYDGFIAREKYANGQVYVTFDNNQFKNATNTNPTTDSDVRYSLNLKRTDESALEDINALGINPKEVLSEGAKALYGHTIDHKSILNIARWAKDTYQSDYGIYKFRDNLENVFKYMQNTKNLNYNDILSTMQDVVRPLIENSNDVNPYEVVEYERKMGDLKTYTFALNDNQKQEIKYAFGSIANFKKQYGRYIKIKDGGTAIDSVWNELAQSFGLDENVSDADMPLLLADEVDKAPKVRNNFEGQQDEVSMSLGLEIIQKYFDSQSGLIEDETAVRSLKSAAKKMGGSLSEYQELVKNKQRETAIQKAEKAKTRQLRKGIEKDVNKMVGWLKKPTDNDHVPEQFKKSVLTFLSSLDLTSPKGAETKSSLMWKNNLQMMQNMLEKSKTEDGIGLDEALIDDELASRVRELTSSKATTLNDLTYSEMNDLYKVVKAVKHLIQNTNKTLANDRYQSVSELGHTTIEENKDKKQKKEQNFISKTFVQMMDSFTYFEQLGDSAKTISKSLRKGFDTRTWHIKEATDYMADLNKKYDTKGWFGVNPKEHTFELADGNVSLTTSQIMNLYLLKDREQAKGHLYGEGIVSSTKKHFSNEAHAVTQEEVQRICDTLTDDQKAYAHELQKFMNNCAEWGNNTSMKMYGYKKFGDEYYWPIKVDNNTTRTNDSNNAGAQGSMYSIKNMSASKAVVDKAANAVVLNDVFDVFTSHVVDMANYDGFVAPLADAMRWYNYKETASLSNGHVSTNTVKRSIEGALGQAGRKYFEQLIIDINNGQQGGTKSSMMETAMGGYKAAAVGGNLRVVIQQPTAYLRAMNVMNARDLMSGLFSFNNVEEAKQNSAIAWWKAQGYYDTYIGQSLKSTITGEQNAVDKIKDKASWAAGMADEVTWGHLWGAVKSEVHRLNPELDVKSDEFMKKTAERFDDIIDRTQVVDSVLHRSELLRSKDGLVKMEMAFMNEPTKSFNMLQSAIRNGDKGKIARAFTTYIATGILTAAAAGLVDIFRDDDDEPLLDSYLQAILGDEMYTWLTTALDGDASNDTPFTWDAFKSALGGNIGDNVNPLASLPVLKDVFSVLQGYDATRMDLSTLTEFGDAVTKSYKYLSDLKSGTTDSTGTHVTAYGAYMQMAKALSYATGVPLYNVTRDFAGIYQKASGNYLEKTKTIKKYDALDNAIEEGDLTAINDYYEGVTDSDELSTITSGITSHLSTTYKDQYLELLESNRSAAASLKSKLVSIYVTTHSKSGMKKSNGKAMTSSEIKEKANKWIEDWSE